MIYTRFPFPKWKNQSCEKSQRAGICDGQMQEVSWHGFTKQPSCPRNLTRLSNQDEWGTLRGSNKCGLFLFCQGLGFFAPIMLASIKEDESSHPTQPWTETQFLRGKKAPKEDCHRDKWCCHTSRCEDFQKLVYWLRSASSQNSNLVPEKLSCPLDISTRKRNYCQWIFSLNSHEFSQQVKRFYCW